MGGKIMELDQTAIQANPIYQKKYPEFWKLYGESPAVCQDLSPDNLDLALEIQHELFPNYSARINYEESLSGITDYKYYLIFQGGNCVGISGIYSLDTDPESAWLGWFGIRTPYRSKGLGSQALSLFEQTAVKRGFKYARLYTDKFDNETAITFYQANGYTAEDYENPDDPASKEYPVLIFSKALGNNPPVPWNNRFMGLTDQIEKQKPTIKS